MNEDELKDLEETFRRLEERSKRGGCDPLLVIFTSIKEGDKFDIKQFINRYVESIKYEGPERRGFAKEVDRPLREVFGVSG